MSQLPPMDDMLLAVNLKGLTVHRLLREATADVLDLAPACGLSPFDHPWLVEMAAAKVLLSDRELSRLRPCGQCERIARSGKGAQIALPLEVEA